MIKRIFNEPVTHHKLRLHSSEKNSSWDEIFEEFKNELTDKDIRYYPNVNELNFPLSKFYGTGNFITGFGSDRCIKYFFEVHHMFKNLVISDPSFSMYEVYGQMFGMNIKKIPYKGLHYPIDDVVNSVEDDTIIVLSNPSSPVGDIIKIENIIRILELGVPTLIDEAYIEFSDEKSLIDLIDKYSNLYVTRTFSKAFGSAGARFGLIFTNKNNIDNILQYRDMYEITGLTLRWVSVLLKNLDKYEKYINDVKRNRKFLIKEFNKLGYDVITSNCNWIHVKGFKNLPENIIFRKDCSLPNRNDNWIRLQITDNLNDYICLLKSREIVNID